MKEAFNDWDVIERQNRIVCEGVSKLILRYSNRAARDWKALETMHKRACSFGIDRAMILSHISGGI